MRIDGVRDVDVMVEREEGSYWCWCEDERKRRRER